MQFATSRSKRAMKFAVAALTLGWLVLTAGASLAQVGTGGPPGIDHYLVYPVLNPPRIFVPIITSDQFLHNVTQQALSLDYFMTPVNKNFEGVIDDITHYTWWRVNPVPFGATVLITNQFGDMGAQVLGPRYLLNPAFKSIPPQQPPPPTVPLPFKNHYLAYDAISDPFFKNVTLVDQFWSYKGYVDFLRYLAPPVEKIFQGQIFQILDPIAHLAVYDFHQLPPMVPPPGPVFVRDEFGIWQLNLGQPIWLCVPSFKTGVVGTNATSWGKLKTLYR